VEKRLKVNLQSKINNIYKDYLTMKNVLKYILAVLAGQLHISFLRIEEYT